MTIVLLKSPDAMNVDLLCYLVTAARHTNTQRLRICQASSPGTCFVIFHARYTAEIYLKDDRLHEYEPSFLQYFGRDLYRDMVEAEGVCFLHSLSKSVEVWSR